MRDFAQRRTALVERLPQLGRSQNRALRVVVNQENAGAA